MGSDQGGFILVLRILLVECNDLNVTYCGMKTYLTCLFSCTESRIGSPCNGLCWLNVTLCNQEHEFEKMQNKSCNLAGFYI